MTARCPHCGQDVPLQHVELLVDPGHPFTVLAPHTTTLRSYEGPGQFTESRWPCKGSREEVSS